MHFTIQNLINIENKIKSNLKIENLPKIIAISKTFKLEQIIPLIDHGHLDFGENKVQEAIDKWSEIKIKKPQIKLHMVGKLQTNKVKFAVKLFDYIHSVDSQKLVKKIADEKKKVNRDVKIFLQVNIGNEAQKSGVNQNEIEDLVFYSKELGLNPLGLMCIPPNEDRADFYFKKMSEINKSFGFNELSMGMSSDYLQATQNKSTYLRIGSSIFGERS